MPLYSSEIQHWKGLAHTKILHFDRLEIKRKDDFYHNIYTCNILVDFTSVEISFCLASAAQHVLTWRYTKPQSKTNST